MVAAHTAPPIRRGMHCNHSTAWGVPPAVGAVCCLARASQFRVGVERGPFRVAGSNIWEAAGPPSRLTLRLAGRVTRSVAVDLRDQRSRTSGRRRLTIAAATAIRAEPPEERIG